MYRLSRLLLIPTVLLIAYCGALLVAVTAPQSLYALGIVLAGMMAKRGYKRLTTLGSARWADESDLRKEGMIDG